MRTSIKRVVSAAAIMAIAFGCLGAQAQQPANLGARSAEQGLPFTVTPVANFNLPWRIAFLPDGRMLITEKGGPVSLVTQKGEKTPIKGAPAVVAKGQGGMLGVFLSPTFSTDGNVYLTYAEPGLADDGENASGLALARAKLVLKGKEAKLEGLKVLWRQMPKGQGGQFGAIVAFSPDGNYLYLTVGERQRMTPAQDPDQELGKILRLTLDGKPAPGNPGEGKTGAASVSLIAPPADTEAAKTAPVLKTYKFPQPNLAPAEVWSTGHRTPYGLAFARDGRLWEIEHGPKGGDELNLIEPGKNYGWPLVSYATNYNGVPIPSPDTRTDLEKPKLYWTPVIAPGNLTFYNGDMFPQWKGSALVGGLSTKSLNRIVIDGSNATGAERWDVGHRIRDVAVAPDGAVWMIEDANPGGLFRVTPK